MDGWYECWMFDTHEMSDQVVLLPELRKEGKEHKSFIGTVILPFLPSPNLRIAEIEEVPERHKERIFDPVHGESGFQVSNVTYSPRRRVFFLTGHIWQYSCN